MKKKYIFMLIILLGITLPNGVYASGGAISGDSIVSCNGKYYGQHGDGHWHEAVKKDNGRWYPKDTAIYTSSNPCGKVTTTKKKTTTSKKITTLAPTTPKKETTTRKKTTTKKRTTTTSTTTSTTISTTVATSKKKTTSTKTTTKKIEEDINSEESTSSPVIGTLLLGAGGAYVYNEYKKTKLKK